MMLAINDTHTDPYFNIAAEEYLLNYKTNNSFRLWICQPAVIVGKNQNAFAEINYECLEENNIYLIRRVSGGGTVYIDPGTLNFSFILDKDKAAMLDYQKMLDPVISYLNMINVPAKFSGKSNITVNKKKISGNAQHATKERFIHHGTILVKADLLLLNKILDNKAIYCDKAVKSVPAKVANINADIETFRNGLYRYLKSYFKNCEDYVFDHNDAEKIKGLVQKKYALWDWNYGRSPGFVVEKEIKDATITINVEKGYVHKIIIDAKDKFPSEAYVVFNGIPYKRDSFKKALQKIEHYLHDIGLDQKSILWVLF